MRFELKRIQRDLGLTTIYVTHDQGEALALSHEIAVMNEGRIVQVGTPREIYDHPRTKFVADFIGTTNFIDGVALGKDGPSGRWTVRTPIGDLLVHTDQALTADMRVTVSIRPEDVELLEEPAAAANGQNLVSGLVDQKVFLGDIVDFQIKINDYTLLSRAHPSLRTPIGGKIYARMNPEKCVAIPDTSPVRAAA